MWRTEKESIAKENDRQVENDTDGGSLHCPCFQGCQAEESVVVDTTSVSRALHNEPG